MISDPSVYESVNDILIGINESRLLRWLIRNRQGTGIQKRYDERKKNEPPATVTPTDVKSRVAPEVPPAPPLIPATTTSESVVPVATSTGP
jgi:hypothetical protein